VRVNAGALTRPGDNAWQSVAATLVLGSFVGRPATVLGHAAEEGCARIPLVSDAGLMPKFNFPQSSLVYFQFVFAAITPLLFLGSVLGSSGCSPTPT
jgi:ammonia channel protein AmtB